MKVSVLNENTAGKRGFLAEHGLSLLIEQGDRRYLFDTGQTDVFLHNAKKLGESLDGLDGIILSHGHFDHCGGLEYLKERGPLPHVYVRRQAFFDKQARNPDGKTCRIIGIPWKRELLLGAEVLTEDRQEIAPGIWVLGNVPYTVDFETRPDQFVIKKGEERIPDYMEDEQLLVIDTQKGLCVFAGCCHAGIINCLSYVKSAFPGKKIFGVLAGMHLSSAGKERIEKTIETLKGFRIPVLMPVHCTGIYAIGRMKEELGENCVILETGKSFEL